MDPSQQIPDDGTAAAMDRFAEIVNEARAMHDGNGSRIGYFAALYHGVTKSMIGPLRFQPGLIVPGDRSASPGPGEGAFFDDADRLDNFVWIFAKRYFDAYERRNSLEPNHPWKRHFEYCDDPNSSILQILTSGANAHMVLDLPMAAIKVVSLESDEPISDDDNKRRAQMQTLKRDFDSINTVLTWQIEACQQQVLDKSPVLRIVNRVPRVTAWLVRQLIGQARKGAWSRALKVKPDPMGPFGSAVSDAETEEELRQAVGDWAQIIARPPLPIHLALRYGVARFETAPINEITEHLMDAEFDPEYFDELRAPG